MSDGMTDCAREQEKLKQQNKQLIFLDNSRISAFKRCPKNYQINHVLNWSPAGYRAPLSFGGAWHEGIASIHNDFKNRQVGNREDMIKRAQDAFMAEWQVREMPDPTNLALMEQLFPRVPGTAFELLRYYAEQKWDWLHEVEILEVERPFVVPLFETEEERIFLIGRKDLVYRDTDGIWAGEAKTTSLQANKDSVANGAFFQRRWVESWGTSPQINGYTMSLKAEYGEEAQGAMVMGTLVSKNMSTITKYGAQNLFKNIPIYKDELSLKIWYEDTKFWVKMLLEAQKRDHYPHNEEGCQTQYGPCDFKDVCEVCPNPETIPGMPAGFKYDHWEPFDEAELKAIITRLETQSG